MVDTPDWDVEEADENLHDPVREQDSELASRTP